MAWVLGYIGVSSLHLVTSSLDKKYYRWLWRLPPFLCNNLLTTDKYAIQYRLCSLFREALKRDLYHFSGEGSTVDFYLEVFQFLKLTGTNHLFIEDKETIIKTQLAIMH